MKWIMILAMLLLLVGCSSTNTFKVGVIAPLSGNQAFIGNDFKEGLELNSEIEYVYQDSQGSVIGAVSAYHQLRVEDVDAMVVVSSGDEAILELADKDEIPLILTVSSTGGLPSKSSWVFRYFTNADSDAPVIVEYATEDLEYNNFAILHVVDNFGYSYATVFQSEVEKMGGTIVGVEQFQYTDYEYRTQLLKLEEENPDAIYVIGLDYQIAEALKEINELNIDVQVLSLGTIATDYAIGLAEGTAEGVYTTAFCTDGTPENYKSEFEVKYGYEPGFFSELGNDIDNFIELSEADDNVEFRDNLLSLKNVESNAGLVSSDSNGELIMPVCVKKIQDGKILNLQTGKYYNED